MRPRIFAFLAFLLILVIITITQTFIGPGAAIPDDGLNTLTIPLNVSGLLTTSLNRVFGLKNVYINIAHPNDEDLHISLVAPDGTVVKLTNGNGYEDDNFVNTCFDESSSASIFQGYAPFTGSWRPIGNFGFINNGQNGNGTWKLLVQDSKPGNAGRVINWSVEFGWNAPVIAPFSSSNLPIVLITTNGKSIPDEPKIAADMKIVDNGDGTINYLKDPQYSYAGKIGIELRGSYSQTVPKLSYGFETRSSKNKDSNVVLLTLGKGSDWVLNASYVDKSLLNNKLAYHLFREGGDYAPRLRFVELVLNGQYQGVYLLTEKIQKGKQRVNIAKLTTTDTSGAELTGGYIIKIDKLTGSREQGWYSSYDPPAHSNGQRIFYQYDYPGERKITAQQRNYIRQFVGSFEHALHDLPLYDTNIGWRKYADERSFIKYFILNEVANNVDGFRLSTYLYKNKITDGGKLFIGPPWDFDIAFHNANYCGGDADTGWACQMGNRCPEEQWQVPFWWQRLLSDTIFQNHLRCEYDHLRKTYLDTTVLFGYINSNVRLLRSAQERNFRVWPVLGTNVWPNPTPIPSSYEEEIQELKQFLSRRIAWLDRNLPGRCEGVRK